MPLTGLVGRWFPTVAAFENYLDGVIFNGWSPKFVVVHNTSSPDDHLYQQWLMRPNWTHEQWLRNLKSYYVGLGWSGMPHLFVARDGIGVGNPLNTRGTHAPSWNTVSWGVETVAEFEREPFTGTIRDNLIGAVAALHTRVGLNPADYKEGVRGIHFHKEDPLTTHKSCPGDNLEKPQFVHDVVVAMQGSNPGGHIDAPMASHEADTSHLTEEELTSRAWIQKTLNALGASPPLKVDGVIGPATKGAVKLYQAQHGLTVDGIAGPLTRLDMKARLTAAQGSH